MPAGDQDEPAEDNTPATDDQDEPAEDNTPVAQNPAPKPTTNAPTPQGKGFALQNGKDAQKLNAQFATLSANSSCTGQSSRFPVDDYR